MKFPQKSLGLTFSVIPLAFIAGMNGLASPWPAQADSFRALTGKNTLMASFVPVPSSLVGKYVGNLKSTVVGSCPAISGSITIVVADNGAVSATSSAAAGPNGIAAQFSSSVSPPLIAGEYIYYGWQGFWQGQIEAKEIIGGGGVYNCRFIFSNVKKVSS